ncbi:MAG: trehalose-phosphatase [Micrococcales bacterium]|nr:trehalose-phosphatase [Micrococcales bacterium]
MSEPCPGPSELADALTALAADPGRAPVLLALDFDGTLAPLQDDPEQSRILPAGVVVLRRLAGAGVRLALVSGRGLTTLARLAEVPVGTVLVGSHGAERARLTPAGLTSLPDPLTPAQADRLATAGAQLARVVRGREGVWVETKPAAVVVHTRLAAPDVAEQALTQARTVGARLGAHVLEGKDVVELAVVDVDKGTAVTAVRAETGATTVVYAGDDRTDEHALAALRPGDLGIKVGAGQTRATFRVPDPQAVVAALEVLADTITGTR